MLKVVDIAKRVARSARRKGIPSVVDNTFATPMLQRRSSSARRRSWCTPAPSTSTATPTWWAACIVTSDDGARGEAPLPPERDGGGPRSPFDCYMVLRGLKTLPVRMERHVKSASSHRPVALGAPQVEKVYYPGLPEHPQRALAGGR
jgi:cystathionine beta-lyase/cystathionine gamma-synthase